MSLQKQGDSDVMTVLAEKSEQESLNISNLEEYSEDLTFSPVDMDDEAIEAHDDIQHEEEVIHTDVEVDSNEIEVNSEEHESGATETTEKKSKSNMPPLRLLNIAPKPEQVPISVKSIGGQPVLIMPGSTGNQTFKIVNQQGQEINFSNCSVNRPITIKPTGKIAINNTSGVQQSQAKQIFMKKVVTAPIGARKAMTKSVNVKTGQQFVMVQKAVESTQQIKLVQANPISSATSVQGKTLTLSQAQELGLLGNTKIIQSGIQQSGKRTVLINKTVPKTVKLVTQSSTQPVSPGAIKTVSLNQVKSPTKILPAGVSNMTGAKGLQKIIIKNATNQILPAGQLIQVSGTHRLSNGQIHQINVPGKGVQYIKFVSSTTADSTNSAVTLVNSVSNSPTVNVSEMKPVLTPAKVLNKTISRGNSTQVMFLPAGYLPTTVQQVQKVSTMPTSKPTLILPTQIVTTPSKQASESTSSPEATSTPHVTPIVATEGPLASTNGIRPRKPCNCTRSQCLKLYCDCFANGEFCYLCNCMNCFNNLENEVSRNLAIKACLERNPSAFRPKIGKAKDNTGDVLRKHTKGCNCKRSGCLKNYCECYEAKIACSGNCKCVGCRNVEDAIERKTMEMDSTTLRISDEELAQTVYRKILPYYKEAPTTASGRPRKSSLLNKKHPITYITDEVIEATCQCLLTISDDADSNMQDEELTKRQIIEEFGTCLKEIINCSMNRNVS